MSLYDIVIFLSHVLLVMAFNSKTGENYGRGLVNFSPYGELDFSPYGGLLRESCQGILALPQVLENNVKSLMRQALDTVSGVQPLLSYLHEKVELYKKKRKHDNITIVGSMGNKLFFPERLSDGSYQIEMDLLFERPLTDLPIPVTADQEDEENQPKVVLRVDTFHDTLPPGMSLLQVAEVNGNLIEKDKEKFFKTHPLNGKTYLNSYQYLLAIPSQGEKTSDTIMGEKEIDTHSLIELPTLFRTFKTDRLTIAVGEKEFECMIMMDKVAAVKIPWPFEAREFGNRPRKWPPLHVIQQVVQDGCHLVHRPSNAKEEHNLYMAEWKFTFSTSEQNIVLGFSESQRVIFLLIKQIKRLYLDIGIYESGEPISGLTTYHLKTVFLHVSEKINPDDWDLKPVECFISFFKELLHCLENNFIPHYFIPNINILSSAWGYRGSLTLDELTSWENAVPVRLKLAEAIRNIVKHPGNYIDGYLLTAVDERHIEEARRKYQTDYKIPRVEENGPADVSILQPESGSTNARMSYEGSNLMEVFYSRDSSKPSSTVTQIDKFTYRREETQWCEKPDEVPKKKLKLDTENSASFTHDTKSQVQRNPVVSDSDEIKETEAACFKHDDDDDDDDDMCPTNS